MDDRKPIAPLIGANGNIFNLLSIAMNSLTSIDRTNDAYEMLDKVTNSNSYNDALNIIGDYVEFGEVSEQTPEGNLGKGNGFIETLETIRRHQSNEHSGLGSLADKDGIDNEESKVGNLGLYDSKDDAVVIYGLNISNQAITRVDFTQELHITNSNIDGIMESALEEGVLNWYESISSSPTSIEKVETNLISNGGTIYFKIQGEEYSRTFDKHDLIYGLLRELPDCLQIINGDQINTAYLDNEHIDHIIQYGLFGEIEY